MAKETWITGIGIVSCLGEGVDAHWAKLQAGQPVAPAADFAPYLVHPLVQLDFDKQIPKKGDQRQMEAWQRIGTYAAGLALDSAGAKGKAELLSDMDMIVAAGGGERDLAVDTAILAGVPKADNPPVFVNERLMNDLRPTLFLAQLSNLLAGNISIVHGVIGSSRTFMGEDSAGVDAVRIAMSRIGAGQSKIALVGGAYNSERWDIVQHLIMGGVLRQGEPSGVWERAANGGGTELGTIGAFLVLEESEHARARGAKGWAKISAVQSDRTRRKPGEVRATLTHMWDKIAPATDGTAVISGATGIEPATSEERDFLGGRGLPVRGTNTYLGQALEPQFPINIALAAAALDHKTLFPPCDRSGFERPMDGPLSRVVVTSVGLWRGEAMALVEAV